MRVIEVQKSVQPELPRRFVPREDEDGTFRDEIDWPEATVAWWDTWAMSPLSGMFTSMDWAELQLAALAHAAVMEGDLKMLPELRLRTAKFGATPEDRARLKIQFEMADAAEERAAKRVERRREGVRKRTADPRLALNE
ncbi:MULTISPECIES: hypothetical protein [unclassified Microbacterium]|uniref:phage terminase small subunit n=1 Tax=unclassified Microbacterium TaxID=2609290 RepID=UPI00386D1B58